MALHPVRYTTIFLLPIFLLLCKNSAFTVRAFCPLLAANQQGSNRKSGVVRKNELIPNIQRDFRLYASTTNKISTKRRTWDESYALLLEYKIKHGNCNVPSKFKEDPKLGKWVDSQRQQYKNSKLRTEKVEKLNEIGFQWKLNRSFDENYQLLMQYKEKFGDCNVPRGFEDDPVLGNFVHKVRVAYNKDSLPKWRVDKLNEIGFVWEKWEDDWWKMYQQLATYYEIHGHCDYPTGPHKSGDALSRWVFHQRQNQKFLTESRTKALNGLGFTWTGVCEKKRTNQWMQRFEELKEFEQIYSHTKVPADSGPLGNWVRTQRRAYIIGSLTEDRKALLESIGFAWRLKETSRVFSKENEERWFAEYDKLVQFKKQHNHTLVPKTFKEDPFFGRWVDTQRRLYKKGRLRNDRKQILEEIGIVWSFDEKYEQQWQNQYAAVAMFYQENGNWPNTGTLNTWIRNQRLRKSKGTLEQNRESLLNEIKFDWSGPKGREKG